MAKDKDYIPIRRFPQFILEKSWDYVNANELFEPIVNKNHNSDLPVLAITQDQGAVPREMIDYKVVEVGDFIISLRSFQGGIEYSNYKGLCSPAYIILRKKNDTICNDFYRHYFKSWKFIQDLNRNLEGTRDGKMVSYQQFSEIKIPYPSFVEQQRIAESLSSADKTIKVNSEKLEILKCQKEGLMQTLFTQSNTNIPKIRFEEYKERARWKEYTLGDITDVVNRRNKSNRVLPIYSVNNKDGFIPQSEQFDGLDSNNRGYDISMYKIVGKNTFAYNPARINVGSIGYSGNLKDVLISSLYV